MTIAACYISAEGVVLGADSTSSVMINPGPGLVGFHYFNHNQKLFELGEHGTIGILTWNLGGLGTKSYRTLFAQLADDLQKNRPTDLTGVATRWADQFWKDYDTYQLVQRCKALAAMSPHGQPAVAGIGQRNEQEENEFKQLKEGLVAGFCLAGYWLPDRTPGGFTLVFDPLAPKPAPQALAINSSYAWGAPNLFRRLIKGIDDGLKGDILASGHWKGAPAELEAIVTKYALGHAILPIRDAVDYVYSCIHSTIRAMKFSNLFQICGGPIELAVITTDRNFRWIRHKTWDSAVNEG